MATPGKGVLLDTSVVVRHFRDGNAVVSNIAAYEELYLPHVALAELYAGAFRSANPEKNTRQIIQFLGAVDVILAGYWRVWSDYLIHRIHLRVLNHIKAVSEGGADG